MRKHILLLVFVCVLALAGAFPTTARADDAKPEYTELSQLNDLDVGTVLGTTYDSDVLNYVPDGPTFKYYSEMSEMLVALKRGRIAACCLDKPVADIAISRNVGLALMPQDAGLDANAVAMPKGSPLTEKVSAIVSRLVKDGTMDQLENEWCNTPESDRSLPQNDWPTNNGVIRCAVDDATEPMSYRNDKGELVGLEVELANIIAKELNCQLVLVPMSFDSVMTSLSTHTVDMAIAGISITDERSELFDLSPAYRSAKVTLVTRDVSATPINLLSRLSSMVVSSFMRYGHGEMLLGGLFITLLLVVLSIPLGLAAGTSMASYIIMLSDSYGPNDQARKRRLMEVILRGIRTLLVAYETIMLEVPIVLVLLVLRYLLFGTTSIPSVVVSIVGLAAALAASVSSIIRDAVDSMGRQPWEEASSLGYTRWQTIRHVILPLVQKSNAASFHAAIVQTVFDTSVVGLIAVHDITRVADLVRARTTEALPGMFVTTVVYLVLSKLLSMGLKMYTDRQDQGANTAKSQS